MPDRPSSETHGPLILGSTGRIGRAFRHLWASGHWPEAAPPLWHGRHPGPGIDLAWDMSGAPPTDPQLERCGGLIVLAGGQGAGTPPDPGHAARLAEAALALADRAGIAPVLVASSQAVYAPTPGPHTEAGPRGGQSAYGRAKIVMEDAIAGRATALRIGNVAGADMLLTNAARGPVRLDRFADGHSPRRCYIGPITLARVLMALIRADGPLPDAINIAAPGLVEMADLLRAAGQPFDWRDAPETALPEMRLDLTRLAGLMPLDPASGRPEALISEARAAGWSPAP